MCEKTENNDLNGYFLKYISNVKKIENDNFELTENIIGKMQINLKICF